MFHLLIIVCEVWKNKQKLYQKERENIWVSVLDSVSSYIIQGVLVDNLTDCKITSVINNYSKMVLLSKSN